LPIIQKAPEQILKIALISQGGGSWLLSEVCVGMHIHLICAFFFPSKNAAFYKSLLALCSDKDTKE